MQLFNCSDRQPITWRMSIGFVVLATLILIAFGYLSSAGLIPMARASESELVRLPLLTVWMNLAIFIGVVLPVVCFVIGFKYSKLRKVYGFYFLVLGIQIATEQLVSQYWISNLVVLVGTLYTAFRIWQLWTGIQLVKIGQGRSLRYRLSASILWLNLCFWTSNLFVLLLLIWLSIFED